MAEQGTLFVEESARRIARATRAVEDSDLLEPRDPGRPDKAPIPYPRRAILLADCPNNTFVSARLTGPHPTREVQVVKLAGATGGGGFRLLFADGEHSIEIDPVTLDAEGQTDEIPWDASVDEFRDALTAHPGIEESDVEIEQPEGVEETIPVWIVTFRQSFVDRVVEQSGASFPAFQPKVTGLEPTLSGNAVVIAHKTVWRLAERTIPVGPILPVGTPTPLRAGNVVVCEWFPGYGWGIIGAEPRVFEELSGVYY